MIFFMIIYYVINLNIIYFYFFLAICILIHLCKFESIKLFSFTKTIINSVLNLYFKFSFLYYNGIGNENQESLSILISNGIELII